jgi:hypothetical protein
MNRQAASPFRPDLRRAVITGLAVAALGVAASAGAVEIQSKSGAVTGSWDTTLSFGTAWRLGKPDPILIGTAEGGTGRSPNGDNGDLNYAVNEPFSEALKLTTELSLKYQNYGLFARGSALYDFWVMDHDTARTPISDTAKNVAGSYARLLDAFVYGKWQPGATNPFELRLGKQIVSWGESTFIQGGLTAVNPLDLSALRVPGAEIKEAFLPQLMARATLGLTKNLSTEAFYLFDWKRTEPEPEGTYFSTNDYATRGGKYVFLGFGALSDQGTDFRSLGGPFITNFQGVPAGPRIDPQKSGQYGVALRWFLPNLGSGTELGLYFMNYASRLPLISGRSGSQTGLGNAVGTATAVSAAAQALVGGATPAAAINFGAGAGLAAAKAQGGDISAATLAGYATIGVNTLVGGGTSASVQAQAVSLAKHEFAETAQYFVEYPKDLQTIGASFNTQLGTSGVALQGELTYRHNTPLQYDDVELLFAALSPFEQALFKLNGIPMPATCLAQLPTVTRCAQLTVGGPGQVVPGWGRYDVWQFQMTATKAFAQVLGAQQLVVVGEAGVTDIPSLPNKTSGGPNGQGLRLNGPGTAISGNSALACAQHFCEVEPQSRFPSQASWGYRLLARLEYPNALGAWNMNPRVTFQQDVRGTSPGPGGNFIEGRYAFGFGVGFNLQNRWDLDLSYSQFGGAGHYNELRDRSFGAATLKFSF